MQRIIEYLKGVKIELRKVSWPTRKEAVHFTIVVVGLSLVFAVFIGVLDMLFSYLIQKFLG